MGKYIVSRCLRAIVYYVGVIFFTFILLNIPVLCYDVSIMSVFGDVNALRPTLIPQFFDQYSAKWGYIQHPDVAEWINMCWRHIINCISGDYGYSYVSQSPVSSLLAERIANTALLVGGSLFASLLIGSALVSREERTEGRKSTKIGLIVSQIVNSTPIFWVGMVVLFIGAYVMPEVLGFGFPEFGTISYEVWEASLTNALGGIMIFIDVLFHLILPMSVLTLGGTSFVYSTLKTNLSGNLTTEMATEELAKGKSHEYNFYSSLRNSLQVIKQWFPLFINTVILVEVVFNWQGIGRFLFSALLRLDYPAIRGCIITLSLFVILANLIFDIAFNLLMGLKKKLNRLELCELRAVEYDCDIVEKCR